MSKGTQKTADAVAIAAEKLAEPTKTIINIFDNNHGMYRGSQEDTIAISQGAILVNDEKLVKNNEDIKYNHDQDALNVKNSLENSLISVVNAIGVIKGIDEFAAIEASKVLRDLINYTQNSKDCLKMTLDYADIIKMSQFKDRMKGIYFMSGGRDFENLVSLQYKLQRYKEIRKINNSTDSIYPDVSGPGIGAKGVERRISLAPLSLEDVSIVMNPIKNSIDQAMNAHRHVDGSPLATIFAALKKKL